MWRQLLKKNQSSFVIPPHYSKVEVKAKSCVYKFDLPSPPKQWSILSPEGDILREAFPFEILSSLQQYPKLKTAFIRKLETGDWLVATSSGVARLKVVEPWRNIEIFGLTPLVCRLLGSVLVLEEPDIRYPYPWYVDKCLEWLRQDPLPDVFPKEYKLLTPEQKIGFRILHQEEQTARIPPTEREIAEIIESEKGSLVDIQELQNGYYVKFYYRGRLRKIRVDENLRLLDAGMCLNGTDSHHTIDSFLAILKYEDDNIFGNPVYW